MFISKKQFNETSAQLDLILRLVELKNKRIEELEKLADTQRELIDVIKQDALKQNSTTGNNK